MGCIVFAGKGYGAGLSILRPAPLRFAIAVTGGRNVCHILRIRVGLTIKFNGSCISGYAFFRAGGRGLFCRCYSYLRSFLVGCIVFAGKGYGACFSILRPAPLRFTIAVTGGRNVSKHLCLCRCPTSLKGSRIGGFAFLCAGWRFGLCACYRCSGCFGMSAVIFAGTGSSTGASVIVPCVNRIVPIMIDCANNPGILCNFGITVGVAEVFTAGVASPVFFVSIHCAGWCFIFGLYQIMFYREESGITCHFIYAVFYNTTVLSAALVHCGFPCGIGGVGFACNICPTISVIGALLPLIGQRLGAGDFHGKGGSFIFFYFHILWLGGNSGGDFERAIAGRCAFQLAAALYSDCAIVGQSLSIRDSQAGVLSDGQGLVPVDGEVVLQFHFAVHSAILAVKDDTSVAIAACTNLNTRFRIVSHYFTVSCIHHCVAADGQAGSTSIVLVRPIIVNSDMTIATGGQAAIIYRNSRSG